MESLIAMRHMLLTCLMLFAIALPVAAQTTLDGPWRARSESTAVRIVVDLDIGEDRYVLRNRMALADADGNFGSESLLTVWGTVERSAEDVFVFTPQRWEPQGFPPRAFTWQVVQMTGDKVTFFDLSECEPGDTDDSCRITYSRPN